MSTAPVRYPKPPPSQDRSGGAARHRKRSAAGQPWWGRPAPVAAVAIASVVVLVWGGLVAAHRRVHAPGLAAASLAKAAGGLAAWAGAWATQPQIVSSAITNSTGGVYRNPLRRVSGLARGRVDDGVDFTGVGPVYALGDAIVTRATGSNYGWPGGGWITYRLTSGPGAGLVVYVAEDIIPAVRPGQRVSPTTVIGTMFAGGDGIETGWAQPTGLSAESELPQAGAIGGNGPFPTRIGVDFDELLQALGAPVAPNRYQPAYGVLPPGYPATWSR